VRQLVPISTANELGTWYGSLKSYKHAERTLRSLLGTILMDFLTLHLPEITRLLGGPPDLLVPTPSTRGVLPDVQPLLEVASLAVAAGGRLPRVQPALEHTGIAKKRQEYQPSLFRPRHTAELTGARVIVLDDSWASGSATVSAAGAVVSAGAVSALPLAFARLFNEPYWSQFESGRAYARAMGEPWTVSNWPL
jgi:hypothetical protein